MKLVILNHDEVVGLLPYSRCIDLMADALASLARGQVHLPLRMIVRPPDAKGLMALMPAYRSGEGSAYALKAICVFAQNPAIGKDAHQGAVLVFSPETGELLAVINASAITAIRTASVSALATRLLAREDARELAIIGAGVQGRAHLAAISEVRSLRRVRIADAVTERAHKFAAQAAEGYAFPVEASESVESAVRNADIIVTVTNSSQPVLQRDWISDGAHLNAVGASVPQAREIDTTTMAESKLFVDRRQSTLNESGDYLIAAKEGVIGPDHIRGEIGELLTGAAVGRTSDRDITLFKGLGLAVEDLAAAEYVYREAKERQIGTWIDF